MSSLAVWCKFVLFAVIALASGSQSAFAQPPEAANPPETTAPIAQPPAAAPPADVLPNLLPPEERQPLPAAPNFGIHWRNGFYFESVDKRFVFHVGGTLHYDAAFYSATPALQFAPGGTGRFQDGVNPRRMRLAADGTLYERIDFKLEFEFANGINTSEVVFDPPPVRVTNAPGPTHAWITVKDVPLLGNIRIGNQKEWFSLEHLNPHKYLELMERSYLFDFTQLSAFNNGFSPGISAFRTWLDDRVFTGVGAYKNENTLLGFGLGDGEYAVTGRVAALPVWRPEDQTYWHIGGAMSHRDPVDGSVLIRIRDNVRNAPIPLMPLIAFTGFIGVSSQDLYNFETAAVYGPLTLQAEYTANILSNATTPLTERSPGGLPQGTIFFQAWYAEAMCFLTGESRTWDTANAFFRRVEPLRPIRLKRNDADCGGHGFGAWEVGVRFTHVDLSNKAIRAGHLDSVTLGVNWYLNANAKMQFNYDYTQRSNTDTPAQGHIHAFGTRMAVDF